MDEDSITWRGVAVISLIISVVALMLAAGECGEEEKLRGDVQHLERRLDNIRDGE